MKKALTANYLLILFPHLPFHRITLYYVHVYTFLANNLGINNCFGLDQGYPCTHYYRDFIQDE